MSDSTSTGLNPNSQQPTSLARILAIVLPVAVVGLAAYWWSKGLEQKARGDVSSKMVARMFTAESLPPGGGMAFADADNDMVADPPSDAEKLIQPETIVFSYVAQEEALPEDIWKELFAAIKEKTGKDVKLVHFTTGDEQRAALKKGELHLTGVATGLVQSAVEQAGFVPFCTMGKEDGTWGYTMEFIVPAGSAIKKLADVKGHKVTFSTPDSNSGCKAAVVELKAAGFLPERDYQWGFSSGQEESIEQIADKKLEVAPVASDVLARMKKESKIDAASCVSVYTSERFPPATFGYAYNLSPELRDAIKEVLLNFDWKGTGVEQKFGPEGKSKFVVINYKDDWANTRRIDREIADARKAGTTAPAKSGT